ncbi:FTR1 family iron permease [Sporolactobacillus shoreicorticis]|uniref:FTR1 family protein n=1 Tax=Sporolactobacillus shoreicorticis TaxID=1923877 RepID=A0ABW5S875_9BACL|nr:FTR1 family protein [Sporolactobacillus shoreicorticis]MCO7125559.1 FTR1 family iron permease [Sporolactobacillus shoreicorticis]
MKFSRCIGASMLIILIAMLSMYPLTVQAKKAVDVSPALNDLNHAITALQHGKSAETDYSSFKKWWQNNKTTVSKSSLDASIQLSQDISSASLDLLNGNRAQSIKSLSALRQTLQDYQSGLYGGTTKSGHQSLSSYITELGNAKQSMSQKDWVTAASQVKQLQQDWLSVEGDVVSQSQSIYTESEKNLVMMDAYLADPKMHAKALPLVEEMITSLKPLASANYGMWDAALIPIREGLEALLVIGALLTFARKANSKPAKVWIWSGTSLAVLVCLAVGVLVSFLLSVAAFGNNNSLINGWSGVIASLMLLYVGYWLHRNADIKRWNAFITSKTSQAISKQKMISFAALAFIAVLREGMETVIFLIGMAGRMPAVQLASGIAAGFGVLIVIGFLMLKLGVLLPLRPFFMISSFVVFYLCFKFMGSGIHSLQMAGILPSTVSDTLPSINSLSIFPSWYSTIPQVACLLLFIFIILKERRAAASH